MNNIQEELEKKNIAKEKSRVLPSKIDVLIAEFQKCAGRTANGMKVMNPHYSMREAMVTNLASMVVILISSEKFNDEYEMILAELKNTFKNYPNE